MRTARRTSGWAAVLGLTRIDGKSGEYSFFRKAGPGPANLSNTFVISIVEDRSGYLWFGTYGGGLNRYDPRTGRFAAFRHNPADPHSLSHDIVYSLDGRPSRYPLGRNRGWPQPPVRIRRPAASVPGRPTRPAHRRRKSLRSSRIRNGVLWLVSQTLQRFDPATGRFTAYRFDFSGTGTVDRQSSATLVASANGSP